MDKEQIEFLILIRDKVDLEISRVSVKEPLVEISVMLSSRIKELSK
jgi:hypothetical protein